LLCRRSFGFFKPVLAILCSTFASPHGRHQTKGSQISCKPTHFFGFFKTVLAIPNLAHYIFAKNRQKSNKLSCLPAQIGVLRTFGGHLAPLSQKPKPQACGIFFFKQNEFNFKTAVMGYP